MTDGQTPNVPREALALAALESRLEWHRPRGSAREGHYRLKADSDPHEVVNAIVAALAVSPEGEQEPTPRPRLLGLPYCANRIAAPKL